MTVTKTIGLVGCGQMGSRLLQGVLAADFGRADSVEIIVVDPSADALSIARSRADEVLAQPNSRTAREVRYCEDFSQLPARLDLAIFAAASKHRFDGLEQLLACTTVPVVLLEKFLFSRTEQYDRAASLLDERGVQAWVHCPRPYWPVYQKIKVDHVPTKPVDITVTGHAYGLASNAVHFFDLARFLNDSPIIKVVTEPATIRTFDSKRAGYREAYGSLVGQDEQGRTIRLSCEPGDGVDVEVRIICGTETIVVEETAGQATRYDESGRQLERWPCRALFASENTTVFEELLQGRAPSLPSYADSALTHLAFMSELMPYLAVGGDDKSFEFPVT